MNNKPAGVQRGVAIFPILIMFTVFCLSFSGSANATVAHPENPNIVGFVGTNRVCFNNDGIIASSSECDNSSVDEGYLHISDYWWSGGSISGINGCVVTDLDEEKLVSYMACPYSNGIFINCYGDRYALVQTTKSGHFWAVKANWNCTDIDTPESVALTPCLSTDAFNTYRGCYNPTPPVISIKGGYIQADITHGKYPLSAHCADSSDYGRIAVDEVLFRIFICTQSGWKNPLLPP